MQYTLVTSAGQVFQFYIKECAECYKQAYGGVVFTEQVLTQTEIA